MSAFVECTGEKLVGGVMLLALSRVKLEEHIDPHSKISIIFLTCYLLC